MSALNRVRPLIRCFTVNVISPASAGAAIENEKVLLRLPSLRSNLGAVYPALQDEVQILRRNVAY